MVSARFKTIHLLVTIRERDDSQFGNCVNDLISYERVTSSAMLVSEVTRVPGGGVWPVTIELVGCTAGVIEEMKGLGLTAEDMDAILNPDAVTTLVASARVIPVRSGMA